MPEDPSIQFPRFFASAPIVVGGADAGMFEFDDTVLQALHVATSDFLPRRPRGRPCAGGLVAHKYRILRRGEIIFVRIYEDPAACGQPYVALDSGADYAISVDGRILRRAPPDGDSVEVAPDSLDGGIPVESSQVGTSFATPPQEGHSSYWSFDGGNAQGDGGHAAPHVDEETR